MNHFHFSKRPREDEDAETQGELGIADLMHHGLHQHEIDSRLKRLRLDPAFQNSGEANHGERLAAGISPAHLQEQLRPQNGGQIQQHWDFSQAASDTIQSYSSSSHNDAPSCMSVSMTRFEANPQQHNLPNFSTTQMNAMWNHSNQEVTPQEAQLSARASPAFAAMGDTNARRRLGGTYPFDERPANRSWHAERNEPLTDMHDLNYAESNRLLRELHNIRQHRSQHTPVSYYQYSHPQTGHSYYNRDHEQCDVDMNYDEI